VSIAQLRRSLLDERWTVLWYALGIVLYCVLIVAFWPTVKQNSSLFAQYLDQLPEAMTKAFGIADMTRFEGFIGGEILNFMWPLIISVFVIMAASAVVGGEMDRGTFELWLSVPRSRVALLSAKLVAVLAGAIVIVAATVIAIAASAAVASEALDERGVAAAAVGLASFPVCVVGYTALFSAIFATRATAAGLAAAVTVGSYLLGIVSGLSADVEWLKYLALTSAYHPQRALLTGTVEALEIAALLAIGLAGAIGSLIVFHRRDLAV